MTYSETGIESIKNRVIKELTRLELMHSRVPYTYHHDFVRVNCSKATYMSRSEVAQVSATEDELYACAFLQAIAGLTDKQKICSGIHIGLYNWCSLIAEEHIVDIERQLIEDIS